MVQSILMDIIICSFNPIPSLQFHNKFIGELFHSIYFCSQDHCYSKDMIHWIRLPNAIAPDQPYDINGIWTGSTTIVNGTPIIMFTGINENNTRNQCQARPGNLTDPTLTEWIKWANNPFISSPNGRDPSTAFQDDQNKNYFIFGFGTDQLGVKLFCFNLDILLIGRIYIHFIRIIMRLFGNVQICSMSQIN